MNFQGLWGYFLLIGSGMFFEASPIISRARVTACSVVLFVVSSSKVTVSWMDWRYFYLIKDVLDKNPVILQSRSPRSPHGVGYTCQHLWLSASLPFWRKDLQDKMRAAWNYHRSPYRERILQARQHRLSVFARHGQMNQRCQSVSHRSLHVSLARTVQAVKRLGFSFVVRWSSVMAKIFTLINVWDTGIQKAMDYLTCWKNPGITHPS